MDENILKAVLIGGIGYIAYKSVAKATPEQANAGGGGGGAYPTGLMIMSKEPAPIQKKQPTPVTINVEAPTIDLKKPATISEPATKKESHISSSNTPIPEPEPTPANQPEQTPLIALPNEPSINKKLAQTTQRPLMVTSEYRQPLAPTKKEWHATGSDTGIESVYNPITHETTNVLTYHQPSLFERVVGGVSSLVGGLI